MNNEITVGKHRVVLEPDDAITLYFASSPTLEEMNAMIDAEVQLAAGRPFYLLVDLSHVDSIPAPVRRAIGEAASRVKLKAIGISGATFHIRVVAQLVNSALALFRRDPFPQAFFDRREDLLAWVEELRAKSPNGAA